MPNTVIAYACSCFGAGHQWDCPLYHRLIIKYRMCRRMKVINYIKPEINDAIDRLVERRMRRIEEKK